jgi:FkbM family methyltransferase
MSLADTLKFIVSHPLNRENKLGAFIRFIKWQIGSRIVPGEVIYEWINGAKIVARSGETGVTGNIYTGLHEFSSMGYLLHVLREGDLFVDVGANVGSYTILACVVRGTDCFSFEPVFSTFQRLMTNIRLNQLESKAKCFNIGVGDRKGKVAFTSDQNATNHALSDIETSDNVIIADVATLDTILENENPNLIKIDVEGYETLVLKGAEETLKKESLHSVIMELNGSGERYEFDEAKILEMMSDYGFQTYSYNPLDRSLEDIQGKKSNSENTLFIRNLEAVIDVLRNSPIISIHGKQF